MTTQQETWQKVEEVLAEQRFGILATLMGEYPYTGAVAFAVHDNAMKLFFATPRATRKFANLKQHSQASLFISNNSNLAEDITKAIGITAVGNTEEMEKIKKNQKYFNLFILRHPYLKDFINSTETAMFILNIEKYHVVRNFQQVFEFEPGENRTTAE
jgi:general stress protein 26